MNRAHGLEHLLSFCIEQPWAITRPMLAVVANVLGRRLAATHAELAEVRAAVAPMPRRTDIGPAPGVAVIPIHGVIAPRMNMMSDISGGTSYHQVRNLLSLAVADPSIRTIVLDLDTPGGSCAGAPECAAAIRAARLKKPIIASVEYQACSAGFWLASSATEIVMAPSAQVGSIGVFTMHEDLSKALEQLGVNVSVISAGKYKTEGSPVAPLSPEARARIQHLVNSTYGRFVADVATGRGITPAAVRAGYGEGAVVTAEDALALGMVNAIATFEGTLERVLTTPPTLVPPRGNTVVTTAPSALGADSRLAHFQQQQRARTLGARTH
jgi:signal peptide peptidase SppA